MPKIKDLTDAELVEAVAREVLGCNVTGDWGTSGKIICKTPPIGIQFDPFTDMNDLFMVLEKFDKYRITKGHNDWYGVDIWAGENIIHGTSSLSMPRTALEAALAAERGE